jgi:hypothetical protein
MSAISPQLSGLQDFRKHFPILGYSRQEKTGGKSTTVKTHTNYVSILDNGQPDSKIQRISSVSYQNIPLVTVAGQVHLKHTAYHLQFAASSEASQQKLRRIEILQPT